MQDKAVLVLQLEWEVVHWLRAKMLCDKGDLCVKVFRDKTDQVFGKMMDSMESDPNYDRILESYGSSLSGKIKFLTICFLEMDERAIDVHNAQLN